MLEVVIPRKIKVIQYESLRLCLNILKSDVIIENSNQPGGPEVDPGKRSSKTDWQTEYMISLGPQQPAFSIYSTDTNIV